MVSEKEGEKITRGATKAKIKQKQWLIPEGIDKDNKVNKTEIFSSDKDLSGKFPCTKYIFR